MSWGCPVRMEPYEKQGINGVPVLVQSAMAPLDLKNHLMDMSPAPECILGIRYLIVAATLTLGL